MYKVLHKEGPLQNVGTYQLLSITTTLLPYRRYVCKSDANFDIYRGRGHIYRGSKPSDGAKQYSMEKLS